MWVVGKTTKRTAGAKHMTAWANSHRKDNFQGESIMHNIIDTIYLNMRIN